MLGVPTEMRRLTLRVVLAAGLFVILSTCLLVGTAAAQTQTTVTGTVEDAAGHLATFGYVQFRCSGCRPGDDRGRLWSLRKESNRAKDIETLPKNLAPDATASA